MAVGKIEYKKILDDKNLTPTKLKDLYVSSLKNNDTFGGYNKDFATNSSERYTIMTPEAAAAVIANRQQAANSEDGNQNEETATSEETVEETPIQTQTTYTPIQGGIWPMIIDSEESTTSSSTTSQHHSNNSFDDQSDFVEQMTNAYATELQRRGYNPAFAEYLVAQDALESGWGKHQSGKNNFGGIKLVGTGKGSTKKTKEWNGRTMETVSATFRDFDSLQDYVNYKINLVGNSNYNVFAYSPNQYFNRMKAGGYATDPNYVNKMNQMLQSVRSHS